MDSFEQVGTRSGKQTKASAPQQRRGHTKKSAQKAVATKAPVKAPKATASLQKAVASKSPTKKATKPRSASKSPSRTAKKATKKGSASKSPKGASSDLLALRGRMAERKSARARYNALKARTSERAHKYSLLRASKHVEIGGRKYKLVVSERKLTPYAKFVKAKMAQLKRDGKGRIVFPQTWSYGEPKVDYQLNCSSDAFKAFGKAWKSKTKKTSKSTAKQDVEESIVDTASFEQKRAKKRPLSARKSSKPAKKAKKHSARK